MIEFLFVSLSMYDVSLACLFVFSFHFTLTLKLENKKKINNKTLKNEKKRQHKFISLVVYLVQIDK